MSRKENIELLLVIVLYYMYLMQFFKGHTTFSLQQSHDKYLISSSLALTNNCFHQT